MYNKTIIRFGFCDIQNNQGLGKVFEPKPLTSTLIIEGFTVADVILVVGQTWQNLQWMYGKNRDFDAR